MIVNSIDPLGVAVSPGCCGVDVATAEVQDAQTRASAAEFIGEGEHVLGGSPEPIQRSSRRTPPARRSACCRSVDCCRVETRAWPISFVIGCPDVSRN
jgi:hypothetical protein